MRNLKLKDLKSRVQKHAFLSYRDSPKHRSSDLNFTRESPGGSVAKNLPAKPWDQFLGWEDTLKKAMASHSSILAGKIPQTEEPGGLPSMGLHKCWTWPRD